MARNENSDDPWLQTAAKHLKVQIRYSDMLSGAFLLQNMSRYVCLFLQKNTERKPFA